VNGLLEARGPCVNMMTAMQADHRRVGATGRAPLG